MGRRGLAKTIVTAAALAIALGGLHAQEADKPVAVRGKIESVALYRGQALVTRTAQVQAPEGLVQVLVTDLPDQIMGDSLFAEAEKAAQVRAVRYLTRAVGEAARDEVRKLDADIEALQREIRANEADTALVASQSEYLSKLQGFVAPTAQVEMSKGVLNADTVKSVSGFIFEQTATLARRRVESQEKARELKEKLQLAMRSRDELTRGKGRTAREALVFIEKADRAPVALRLSYVCENATWMPSYNVRSDGKLEEVHVEYNAVIRQMTGEDWDEAALTLSTASPALTAEAPALAPLLVGLTAAGAQAAPGDLAENIRRQRKDLLQLEREMQSAAGRGEQIGNVLRMNEAAISGQAAELAAGEQSVAIIREALREQGSGLSVNYKIPGPVSLASRSDQQLVRVADVKLAAASVNVAVPLLTDRVFRQAEVANTGELALLEGQSNVYFNGDFVGKGTMPMVASGQRFRLEFGSDPQLRAWREFVSRKEAQQGGNTEATYQYRLVLDNYKEAPVKVRVFDRIPYSTDEIDIAVNEAEMKHKLSDDTEYLRIFRPHGILRWDIEVPAKSAAATAAIVEYGYKMEYDRKLSVAPVTTGRSSEEAMKALDMMMNAK